MSALVVALYDNHAAAERVRMRLVKEGFPTDRVQLTTGAAAGRADDLEAQLEAYFGSLFDRLDELPNVHFFVDGVQQGHAALTVHPRGELETHRALEIMEEAQPLEICDHDLDDDLTIKRTAAPDDERDDDEYLQELFDALRESARNRTRH